MLSGLSLNVRGARRVRPTLEVLEGRDCPAAPVINILTAVQAYGSAVVLNGSVSDENPATVAVQFSGAANDTVYPDANGQFSLTTALGSIAAIYATATDEESLSSSTLNVTPANNAPQISGFVAIQEEGPGNVWTFRGRVVDEYAQGLTVYLTGLESFGPDPIPLNVDADGYFSFSISLLWDEYGTACVNVTDSWGVASETAYAIVR